MSKRYKQSLSLIDKTRLYELKEALDALKGLPPANFDETVEITFNLNIDLRRTDQTVRGTVKLPHGRGKQVKVVVFCKGEAQDTAKQAGADFVGQGELIEKISSGWMDFDAVVATPVMMKEVAKLGRLLGPRGLMPSPKTGTVTQDVAEVVRDIKKGKIDFKMDKRGNLHCPIGKRSFSPESLYENALALIETVNRLRPHSAKGRFIKKAYISSTMGPAIKLDPARLS